MRKCKDCGAILGEYDIVCSNCSGEKESINNGNDTQSSNPNKIRLALTPPKLKSPTLLRWVGNVFWFVLILCIAAEVLLIFSHSVNFMDVQELNFLSNIIFVNNSNAILTIIILFTAVEFALLIPYAIFKALEEIVLGVWHGKL